MSEPTWFLLFDGTSADGLGPGKYIGRTTDVKAAVWHFRKIAADPYSTGYVMIVDDDRHERATEGDMRRLFDRAVHQEPAGQ